MATPPSIQERKDILSQLKFSTFYLSSFSSLLFCVCVLPSLPSFVPPFPFASSSSLLYFIFFLLYLSFSFSFIPCFPPFSHFTSAIFHFSFLLLCLSIFFFLLTSSFHSSSSCSCYSVSSFPSLVSSSRSFSFSSSSSSCSSSVGFPGSPRLSADAAYGC